MQRERIRPNRFALISAFGSILEASDVRILRRYRLDVPEQPGPALEVVRPRDHELRVGQHEATLPDLIVRQITKAGMIPADSIEHLRIPGPERLQQILRLLPGLLESPVRVRAAIVLSIE